MKQTQTIFDILQRLLFLILTPDRTIYLLDKAAGMLKSYSLLDRFTKRLLSPDAVLPFRPKRNGISLTERPFAKSEHYITVPMHLIQLFSQTGTSDTKQLLTKYSPSTLLKKYLYLLFSFVR